MKSHTIIAEPFIEKANRIKHDLELLEREQRTKKSIEDIKIIREKFSIVKKKWIPIITGATGHTFNHPNLFLFVFLYKEINTVFNEAQTNPVKAGIPDTLTLEELKEMSVVSEDWLSLAHIGDAALELGVIASIWPPNTTTVLKKKYLHDERNKLVENIPLSHFWESMLLYDSSTNLIELSDENPDTKGSYMEAVFGIIYLESGLEAVETAIKNMKGKYGKNHKKDS
jgi:hypothetical protein